MQPISAHFILKKRVLCLQILSSPLEKFTSPISLVSLGLVGLLPIPPIKPSLHAHFDLQYIRSSYPNIIYIGSPFTVQSILLFIELNMHAYYFIKITLSSLKIFHSLSSMCLTRYNMIMCFLKNLSI
jgi:hypothetical protein